MRGILYQDSPSREGSHFGYAVRKATHMDGNNGSRRRRISQCAFEGSCRGAKGVAVDIEKTSLCPGIPKTVCGGRKRHGGRQAVIAARDSARDTREVERRRPIAYCHCMPRPDAFRQRGLKAFDRRTLRQKIAVKYRNHGIDVVAVDALAPVPDIACGCHFSR
jgi:hypothetical protein